MRPVHYLLLVQSKAPVVEAGLPASALDQDIQALEAQIADVNGAIIRFVNVDGSYK